MKDGLLEGAEKKSVDKSKSDWVTKWVSEWSTNKTVGLINSHLLRSFFLFFPKFLETKYLYHLLIESGSVNHRQQEKGLKPLKQHTLIWLK